MTAVWAIFHCKRHLCTAIRAPDCFVGTSVCIIGYMSLISLFTIIDNIIGLISVKSWYIWLSAVNIDLIDIALARIIHVIDGAAGSFYVISSNNIDTVAVNMVGASV